jgi:hypothetical protein
MKNLILFICLLVFVSCEIETVTIPKDEYNRLKGIKGSSYPKPYEMYGDSHDFSWKILLGEDGHEYLENQGYDSYVLIHFPSCNKCAKDSTRYK